MDQQKVASGRSPQQSLVCATEPFVETVVLPNEDAEAAVSQESGGARAEQVEDELVGDFVGKYRLVSLLGKGGMGSVYRARHQLLRRAAAVKLLLPSLARQPSLVERFFREAVVTSHIKHPGVVEVYDFGTDDVGRPFLVMELLDGETLFDRLHRQRALPIEESVAITLQLASALEAAHASGVLHRDLKPSNIFLVKDDAIPSGLRVKVLDFGIAKRFTEETGAHALTEFGAVLGTPVYMPPEQFRAEQLGPTSDLYSMGCILFRLLTGGPPFRCESYGDYIIAHETALAPRVSSLRPVPAALDELVAALLAKDPERRPNHGQVRAVLVGIGGAQGLGEMDEKTTVGYQVAAEPYARLDNQRHRAISAAEPLDDGPTERDAFPFVERGGEIVGSRGQFEPARVQHQWRGGAVLAAPVPVSPIQTLFSIPAGGRGRGHQRVRAQAAPRSRRLLRGAILAIAGLVLCLIGVGLFTLSLVPLGTTGNGSGESATPDQPQGNLPVPEGARLLRGSVILVGGTRDTVLTDRALAKAPRNSNSAIDER